MVFFGVIDSPVGLTAQGINRSKFETLEDALKLAIIYSWKSEKCSNKKITLL